MTPKGLLQRAAVIALVYAVLHVAGGRHDAAFLSGTPVGSLVLGCAYVVVYFAFVLIAPILVIAAGLLHVSARVAK